MSSSFDMSDLKSAVVKYGSVAAPLAAYVALTTDKSAPSRAALTALEGGVAAALADYALPANSNMQPLATGAALGAYSYLIVNKGKEGALNTAVQVAVLGAAGAYVGSKFILPWVQKNWSN